MSAIVTQDYICQMMVDNDLPFFTVSDAQGTTKVGEQQDPHVSVLHAIDKLKNIFDNADGSGFLFVELLPKPRKEVVKGGAIARTKFAFKVKVDKSGNTSAAINGLTMPNATDPKVFELMNRVKELEIQAVEQKNKFEIEKLKMEIDNKIEGHDPLTKWFPLISGILQQNGVNVPNIAGLNDPPIKVSKPKVKEKVIEDIEEEEEQEEEEEEKEITPDDLTRLRNVVNALSERDEDYLPMLEAIANLQRKDISTYMTYKAQLIAVYGEE